MKNVGGVVRVGGVGTGRIFNWAHTRVYPKLLDKARLVGFFDLGLARAVASRDKYAERLHEDAAGHPEAAGAVENGGGGLMDYGCTCPVTARLEGLAAGAWRRRHYRIDRDHGNAYTAWIELGRPVVPDDGQLAAITARHGLEEIEPEATFTCDGEPRLGTSLPPHAVSLWTLDKTAPR